MSYHVGMMDLFGVVAALVLGLGTASFAPVSAPSQTALVGSPTPLSTKIPAECRDGHTYNVKEGEKGTPEMTVTDDGEAYKNMPGRVIMRTNDGKTITRICRDTMEQTLQAIVDADKAELEDLKRYLAGETQGSPTVAPAPGLSTDDLKEPAAHETPRTTLRSEQKEAKENPPEELQGAPLNPDLWQSANIMPSSNCLDSESLESCFARRRVEFAQELDRSQTDFDARFEARQREIGEFRQRLQDEAARAPTSEQVQAPVLTATGENVDAAIDQRYVEARERTQARLDRMDALITEQTGSGDGGDTARELVRQELQRQAEAIQAEYENYRAGTPSASLQQAIGQAQRGEGSASGVLNAISDWGKSVSTDLAAGVNLENMSLGDVVHGAGVLGAETVAGVALVARNLGELVSLPGFNPDPERALENGLDPIGSGYRTVLDVATVAPLASAALRPLVNTAADAFLTSTYRTVARDAEQFATGVATREASTLLTNEVRLTPAVEAVDTSIARVTSVVDDIRAPAPNISVPAPRLDDDIARINSVAENIRIASQPVALPQSIVTLLEQGIATIVGNIQSSARQTLDQISRRIADIQRAMRGE